jgi:ELWxxDGT repeat protein
MKKPILLIILIIAAVLPAFSQRVLKDIAQGTDNAQIFAPGSFSSGDTLFFRANNNRVNNYYYYYMTKGTGISTKKLPTTYNYGLGYTTLSAAPVPYKFKNRHYLMYEGDFYQATSDSIRYIKRIFSGYNYSFINFYQLNDKLYFIVCNYSTKTIDCWQSDGTEAGTLLYKSLTNLQSIQYFGEGFYWNNKYYHAFHDGSSNLLVSDGTISGTSLIKNGRISINRFEPFGQNIYFTKNDNSWAKLWKSKGDSLSTNMLIPQIETDQNYSIYDLFKLNNQLYAISFINYQYRFSRIDTSSIALTHITNVLPYVLTLDVKGDKIYYSALNDHTYTTLNFFENSGSIESNTFLFSLAIDYGDQIKFHKGNNKYYVSQQKMPVTNGMSEYAGDVIYWVFDGINLKKITDLVPDMTLGSDVNTVGLVNDIFYFSASDSQHGYELWRTDGTSAGTFMVKDINTETASANPELMFGLGDYVYFMADDISHGNELWRANGTTAALFADINGHTSSAHVLDSDYFSKAKFKKSYIVNISLDFFQITHDGNINPLSMLPIHESSNFYESNDSLYFMGKDGNLWKTDESFLNPKKVIHLDSTNNGTGNFGAHVLTKIGTKLFFLSNNHSQLWSTDGKKTGTLKLISAGIGEFPTGHKDGWFRTFATQNKLFIERYNQSEGKVELWVSDGTIAGTLKLFTTSFYTSFGLFNNKLYFKNNQTLWCTNGTLAGTIQIDNRDFVSGMQLKDKFYLTIKSVYGIEYYELESNNNLKLLNTVSGFENEANYYTTNFYNIDERYLLNIVFTPTHQHFYLTDGNKENIKKAFVLKNALSGNDLFQPIYHNKKIYFTATDSLKGKELWIWDFECPDGYTIRDNIAKDSTIVYGKNIWGQNIVSNNKTVTYDAKNGITLQPGFEVQKGTVFKTKLIGCANNITSNAVDDSSPSKNEPIVKVNSPVPYPQLIDFLHYFPNKSVKEIYEQAERTKLAPVSWDIVTEKDIYRLDLKIGSSVLTGWLPKKN